MSWNTHIPKFRRFVLQNFPFIEEDFDALTDYELICKVVEYLNKVITSQNEVISELETFETNITNNFNRLEALFNELKTFVDNYFENLDVQEEINNKLDEMAESGVLGEIVADYAQTKLDYFLITSESTSNDILSAFASNKSKVIEFEYGTYELTDDLIITSNTIVNMNGATLTRSGSQWFLGYGRDSEYTDYNGIHNVTFNNGSIQLPIALMHNVGIEFNDITFLPVNDHAIQMGGCKDIVINGCTFKGRIINDTISDHFEAVQLESCTRAGQPFLNNADSPSYDSKGNYNVIIKDCVFESGDGSTTKMYTAIGGHSNDENNTTPAENVVIDNCTFQNIWYAQLCPCGFKNSRITNNTFTILNDTGQIQNIRFRYYNENILIENNTFIGGVQNITNVNVIGYCTGLKLINNTFDSEFINNLCNVLIGNWTDVLIKDNVFKHAKYYSIYAGQNNTYYATDVKIVGNYFKVDNLAVNGENIYLRYITNVEIYDNTFVKPVTATAGKYSIFATTDASNISFANNNIQGTEGVFMSGIRDYTNIYSVPAIAYLADESIYTPLTNVTPVFALTQFDRLILVIHKNQDPSKHTFAYIDGYTVGRKITTGNSYSFEVTDGTNSGVVTFTINSDGTFSYTSSDNFTLRRIFGVNSY